mmetsp:Transcript_14375/g.16324  ORF Transcript_14375/g.16324 Transcript_14375/m.16324 type:complete len:469 (+) Transcript_14375:3-1409(+)
MLLLSKKRSGKLKARLVAKGNELREDGDNNLMTYSPTASSLSQNGLFQFALTHNLNIHGMDFESAFLVGKSKYLVYCELPWPMSIGFPNIIMRVDQNMYGLTTAALTFYETANDKFIELEFKRCKVDPCLYIHEKRLMAICLHVDDAIIAAKDEDFKWLLSSIQKESKLIVNETTLEDYLGLEITKNKNGIFLSQKEYTLKILDKFGFDDKCKSTQTPISEATKIYQENNIVSPEQATLYRSMLNSASYLRKTRYDILYALKELAQVQNKPTERAMKELNKLYRYLYWTKNYGLLFRKTENEQKKVTIEAYSDASSNSCPATFRNSGGQVIYVNGSPFYAECKNQSIITDSSNYAECYEVARTTKLLIAVVQLLEEMGLYERNEKELIPIYVDNKATIDSSVKSNMSKRTRHFEIRIAFYKQYVGNLIILKYVETAENVADIFTKALGTKKFHKFCGMMMAHAKRIMN